ncbi:MAG: sodium:solute symporter family protein [Deltaproteobacteria bacterium]|nr:sodium:solute symporter family protein [Deltaproteobacteria bacterium]MBW2019889.1 sodium:solute symporter family protein [Deltaproteobacteria bacterium]MBW2074998.1 sodium:solute symporter family protein [Deltaproteobacteria bacterium]
MIDLIIIVGYFSIMLFVGWCSRRQSAESYWVAERRYHTSRVTASLVATIFGASSTMGIIGLGYSRGLTGAWWSLIGGIALIPFGFFLASRVRALNVYTLPDILKSAYGQGVALPAGLMIAMAWCGVIAAQLIAGGRLLCGIFSLDFQFALGIVAIVFIVYTFWGGQLSVIRTDFWQLVLFVGGLLVSLSFLVSSLGLQSGIWEQVPSEHLRFPVSTAFGWYDVLVFYPLIVGLPYLVGPDIYSRVLCAKNNQVARKSVFLAALVVIPLSFLLAFFGILARAKFPGIPAEAALPETLSVLIPGGLKGLIVVGFLGAIMSSADTCLISASTILSLNVIRPLYGASKEQHLRVTRGALLAVGGTAWLIASQQQGIISSLLLGYTVFVGGVVIPTLATFYQQRLKMTSAGALGAIVVGGSAAILGKIHGGTLVKAVLTSEGDAFLRHVLGPQYLSILPIILSLVAMVGVSRITRSS